MDVGGRATEVCEHSMDALVAAGLEVSRDDADRTQQRIARLAESYVRRFDDAVDERQAPAEASVVPPPPAWRDAKAGKPSTSYSIPNLRARARVWRDPAAADRCRPLAERLRKLGGFPKK